MHLNNYSSIQNLTINSPFKESIAPDTKESLITDIPVSQEMVKKIVEICGKKIHSFPPLFKIFKNKEHFALRLADLGEKQCASLMSKLLQENSLLYSNGKYAMLGT